MEKGKIILVTGANRGIGRKICRQLAELGHQVILTARNLEKGREAAATLKGAVTMIQLDVASAASSKAAADQVESQFGKLDVLINNAAMMPPNERLPVASLDKIRETMESNVYGPLGLAQEMLPLLRQSSQGRIINLSSGMGALDDLGTGYAAYRLSKAWLNSATILLANELEREGIRVNAMCPGWVQTDMGGKGAPRTVQKGAETAVWLSLEKEIPIGKFFRDKRVISW
ncbi:MAG: SDR family oxidoreductase [Bacteroidia bacterium]|nr:SDR family oxidoreductase [Bacteroidia bacterium]